MLEFTNLVHSRHHPMRYEFLSFFYIHHNRLLILELPINESDVVDLWKGREFDNRNWKTKTVRKLTSCLRNLLQSGFPPPFVSVHFVILISDWLTIDIHSLELRVASDACAGGFPLAWTHTCARSLPNNDLWLRLSFVILIGLLLSTHVIVN